MTLLRVEELRVDFPGTPLPAVDGLSLEVPAGGALGLVGGSGSGKSLTLLSIVGLPPAGARVTGRIWFEGTELGSTPDFGEALRRIRGRRIGLVFQEPLAALAPFLTIGAQLADVVRFHLGLDRRAAAARAVELLRSVELADPVSIAARYPHELSGGQRQRAAIALAIAADPVLLLADEPTTAVDAVTRGGILALLARLRRERGLALLVVGHDLAMLASGCDTIGVLFAGRVVERGPVADVLGGGLHPYTEVLVAGERGLSGWRERSHGLEPLDRTSPAWVLGFSHRSPQVCGCPGPVRPTPGCRPGNGRTSALAREASRWFGFVLRAPRLRARPDRDGLSLPRCAPAPAIEARDRGHPTAAGESGGCARVGSDPKIPAAAIGDADLAPSPPPGCVFRAVCPRVLAACAGPTPLVDRGGGRAVACHRPLVVGEAT